MRLDDIVSCVRYILSDAGPYGDLPRDDMTIEFTIGYRRERGDGYCWCLGPDDVVVRT